jgi:hypothetical protein
MSKQSENKEKQGWSKITPCCGNCENFTFEKEVKNEYWGNFIQESNLRCKIGEFKTDRSNYCDFYLKSDEI